MAAPSIRRNYSGIGFLIFSWPLGSSGISDIIEACLAATKGAAAGGSDGATEPAAVQEKARAVSELLRAGQSSAVDKIQDALQYLAYVVLSTSMPAA